MFVTQSSAICCQARKFSLLSTSFCARFCSSQLFKTLSVPISRSVCHEPHAAAAKLDKQLWTGFLKLSHGRHRSISTGRCLPSYGETENISKDSVANSPSSLGFSDEPDDNAHQTSRLKLRSSIAGYTLDEDGYMNIKDLVDFLKRESAIDICVINTSGDRRSYVEYFVIVSGVSSRHLRAMAKNLEQLFRGHEVRGVGRDGHVVIEGLESDHWVALDIGNIVVHFFLPEVREVYELEKLWTLGPKYDDQSRAMLEQESFFRAAELGTKLDNHAGDE